MFFFWRSMYTIVLDQHLFLQHYKGFGANNNMLHNMHHSSLPEMDQDQEPRSPVSFIYTTNVTAVMNILIMTC